jgi:hypothetical protein
MCERVIDGSKIEGLCTGSTLAPTDSRVRWSVIPLRNGTGAYWYVIEQRNTPWTLFPGGRDAFGLTRGDTCRIAPVANKALSLNIKNGKKAEHNPVQLYNGSAAGKDTSSMWYLRLADAAVPNCPEVDKAPTDANSKM